MESLVKDLKIHFVLGKCYRFERERNTVVLETREV